jgi:hypothetical protein
MNPIGKNFVDRIASDRNGNLYGGTQGDMVGGNKKMAVGGRRDVIFKRISARYFIFNIFTSICKEIISLLTSSAT